MYKSTTTTTFSVSTVSAFNCHKTSKQLKYKRSNQLLNLISCYHVEKEGKSTKVIEEGRVPRTTCNKSVARDGRGEHQPPACQL